MKALNKSTNQLDKLRVEIAETISLIGDLEYEPVSREEAIARIDAYIETQATAFDFGVGSFATPERSNGFNGFLVNVNKHNADDPLQSADTSAPFCALMPEVVKRRMIATLDAQTSYGRPLKERAKLKTGLEAEVFKLEQQEESLLRDMESAGLNVTRRGDIRNALVTVMIDDAQQAVAA